jgi:GNAT superfamily N-acetyltransferase
MFIRAATIEDVPEVLPFVRAICDLHESRDPQRFKVLPDVIERYASWLPIRAVDPKSVFLVAQRDAGDRRTLCGYLVGTVEPEIPIFWIPECGWIHDIWLEPEVRGHGAAEQFMIEAERRFREIGVSQLRLHTGVFNEHARAVFGRAGFRPSVIEMIKPL